MEKRVKRHFIINPEAGGYSEEVEYVIRKMFLKVGMELSVDYTIAIPDNVEKMNKIIREHAMEKDVLSSIVICGGDGTINDILESIYETGLRLEVIPIGSGNDFYKSLIKKIGEATVDLGKVKITNEDGTIIEKLFCNVFSLGLDVIALKIANRLKEKYHFSGKVAYALGLIGAVIQNKGIELQINDEELLDYTLIAIANGEFYGGGFPIAPGADIKDGLLDIYEVNKVNHLRLLKLAVKLFSGAHKGEDKVIDYRTEGVSILASQNISYNADGIVGIGKRFDFTLIKNGLNVNPLENAGLIAEYNFFAKKKVGKYK